MLNKLVFATSNAHKVQEVQTDLGNLFEILTLKDIQCYDDIPETGKTFAENAQQKVDYIARHYHIDSFAEDSGLCIEALNGEPGVYSARYGGSRDMDKNIDLVLQKMQGVKNRKAKFVTVFALRKEETIYVFEGEIIGTIRTERSGTGGFGYDSIFQPNGFDVTFAEMSTEEKTKISHRGKALRKLIAFLKGEQ